MHVISAIIIFLIAWPISWLPSKLFFGVTAGDPRLVVWFVTTIILAAFIQYGGLFLLVKIPRWFPGGGLWATPFGRRIAGFFGVVVAAALGLVLWFGFLRWLGSTGVLTNAPKLLLMALVFGGFIGAAWAGVRYGRPAFARATKPVKRTLRLAGMGTGGSAAFAGQLDELQHPYREGRLFLGTSLYGGAKIGLDDDRHMITIASSGGGKNRSAIIPNLLLWPGSVLVLDPKGTNATVTARSRSGLGAVHVLDPFQEVQGPARNYRSRFNPLAAINPRSPSISEDIRLIADALVLPEHGGAHWDDGARTVLTGVMAHVLAVKASKATLFDVRELISMPLDNLREGLANSGDTESPLGRLTLAAAGQLMTGKNEAAGFLSTAKKNTNWLDSQAMRGTLSGSDFVLTDLKTALTSLYVVIPFHLLQEHSRFLRLFANLAIASMSRGKKPDHAVLFILDEFYSLGRMDVLAKAVAGLRSYGIKLWPILQNLGQLMELYERNALTFMANTAAVQIFGVNDPETSQSVASRMGFRVVTIDDDRVRTQLREPDEVERLTGRAGGLQLILRNGEDPFLLRRANYDRMFEAGAYDPDPDFAPIGYYGEEPDLLEGDFAKELLQGQKK